MRCLLYLLVWLPFLCLPAVAAAVEARYIISGPGNKEAYFIELIEAALLASQQTPGDHTVLYRTEAWSTERKLFELVEGRLVNIAWLPISEQPGAKSRMIQIPTPLLGGTLGFRIALVRAAQPDLLKNVRTINDLAQFRLGQGQNWAEIPIYNANGLQVFEALNMNTMLRMLAGGRYDYLPLGITEISDAYDLEQDGKVDLIADQHLLIHYHFPAYFYVSQNAPELAERMTKGMQILEQSGQLAAIFERYFGDRLKQLKLEERHIVHLSHPFFDRYAERWQALKPPPEASNNTP